MTSQSFRAPSPQAPTADTALVLQRKCGCGNAASDLTGECEECQRDKALGLQARLAIGASDDPLEHEADRAAAQVMRPGHAGLASDRSAVPRLSRRSTQHVSHEAAAPPSVHHALQRPGEPLSEPARAFFEPRFGHDFGKVRIHHDTAAARSAHDVNAHAYTVGRDIVFGHGKYAPHSRLGRELLAHELTHVIQQGHSPSASVVQRAEVDDRSCAGLTDIESDIDAEVNAGISAVRSAAATPLIVSDFLKDVSKRLGGRFVGAIETFIQNMPTTKRTDPPQNLSGTKFSGVSSVNRFYLLHTIGNVKVVGPAAKVKNICVGADKFGHFFGEGFIYFTVAKASGGGATGKAAAESTGRFLEISDKQGLGVTGVFSNADLAANLAGKKFYEDLEADPTGFTFKVADYITDKWNEKINPSFYASSEASVIWRNLLSGTWEGKFTSAGGTSSPIDAKIDLNATTAGGVTGTKTWPAGAVKPNKEKIKNGKITQRTTSVSGTLPNTPPETLSETPVSGVTIDFDWESESGKSQGKGRWDSVDEQNLTGTWGIGSSRDNGGTWKLKKK